MPGRIRRGVPDVRYRTGIQSAEAARVAQSRIRTGNGPVLATIALTLPLAWLLACSAGQPVSHYGGALAMSSTAIVSTMLNERAELNTPHGQQIIGILLFQDLAVVPLLILIPALASGRPTSGSSSQLPG